MMEDWAPRSRGEAAGGRRARNGLVVLFIIIGLAIQLAAAVERPRSIEYHNGDHSDVGTFIQFGDVHYDQGMPRKQDEKREKMSRSSTINLHSSFKFAIAQITQHRARPHATAAGSCRLYSKTVANPTAHLCRFGSQSCRAPHTPHA
jgi:hypothetical protein